MRAVRGATTANEDSEESIRSVIEELISMMLSANNIEEDDVVSAFVTATRDISSCFPAKFIRESALNSTPILGAVELDIESAPKRCIRVLMHVESLLKKSDIKHVYLHGAQSLRPDLSGLNDG